MHTFDDIVPPSRRKEGAAPPPMSGRPAGREPQRGSRFPFITLGAIVLVIAVSIGALFYFSSAKVEVTPNSVSA
ncbi:MAG: hypothetical protein Q8O94_02460, partial [bacterium]|nr:hypothetical protein [bacterium]